MSLFIKLKNKIKTFIKDILFWNERYQTIVDNKVDTILKHEPQLYAYMGIL